MPQKKSKQMTGQVNRGNGQFLISASISEIDMIFPLLPGIGSGGNLREKHGQFLNDGSMASVRSRPATDMVNSSPFMTGLNI